MSLLSIILLPLIAAFIGWFTNWIAIKMLFHPKQPKRILGITFQGIFPKRQAQFAEKLGQIVANDLVNIKEIVSSLNSEDAVYEIKIIFLMRSCLKKCQSLVCLLVSN